MDISYASEVPWLLRSGFLRAQRKIALIEHIAKKVENQKILKFHLQSSKIPSFQKTHLEANSVIRREDMAIL